MDGFMDTMDAFHSYQDKEKKLAILKDPHIGAFSVLMLVLYYLIYGAAYAELTELSAILVVGIGFALSRSLSGKMCIRDRDRLISHTWYGRSGSDDLRRRKHR